MVLSKEQLHKLEKNGYLVVNNVLDPEHDIDPILHELSAILDRLANDLVSKGEIPASYKELPFGKRLTCIIQETGESHSQHFDLSLPKGQVGGTAPMYLGDAIFKLITHKRLLDCVKDVIGPEIYSNPVQHVRLKPPECVVPKKSKGMSVLVGETPWHQDNAVMTADADEANVLTVWIPLVDTTVKNGCLIVIPGSHDGTLVQHCPTGQGGVLSIPDSLVEKNEAVAVPVMRGNVLMFHRKLIHASLPNLSDDLRSSLDLRYQPIGQATGRNVFPGFVARSSVQRELRSRDEWEQLWKDAQQCMSSNDYIEQPFDRWQDNHSLCA